MWYGQQRAHIYTCKSCCRDHVKTGHDHAKTIMLFADLDYSESPFSKNKPGQIVAFFLPLPKLSIRKVSES